uniref:Secreted protein n=1 Tax=Kalanchoe fedtschenkoi TaxID=63787 RepID=A0A7N0ZZD6_KALFE
MMMVVAVLLVVVCLMGSNELQEIQNKFFFHFHMSCQQLLQFFRTPQGIANMILSTGLSRICPDLVQVRVPHQQLL